jgi:TatA/E family protein of Tat protein translocase
MLGNIGPLEIVVVLIIALVVFGPKRLPELGRSLGKGIREFRGSVSGDSDDDRSSPPPEIEAGRREATAHEATAHEETAHEEPVAHKRT